MLGVNETAFLNTIHMYLSLSDIFTGILKGFFFGFMIGSIGTYIGYNARGVQGEWEKQRLGRLFTPRLWSLFWIILSQRYF